ncbi:ATP synthase F0 subunit A [Chryseobacterium lacus]|uniref:ATP synthase subunit a n=1 Tax=Chryseobacterium lacus TaxID=2058346 RepID=A0A368MWK1_9FLAO|nr:F0F1 ATP synthase subunit A [Chryseobacterium lacus]RCU42538.1 ATP synthase F0 subunit A [Chryseobacterium lacus]RST27099.1 ATP synthase F0 subunit A [Chryseobacterium lacus]
MIQRIYSLFFVFLFVVFSSSAFAASSTDAASDEKEFNAVEMIMHHIGDANEWHLFTLNEGTPDEKHVSIPLPVIVKDPSGWHFFMSSDVAHGEIVNGYTIDHGIIKNTEGLHKASLFNLIGGNHTSDNSFFDFSITKNVFSMFLSVIFMLFIFISMAKNYRTNAVPKGAGKLLEPLVLFIRDEVAIPNIGAKYQKYLPYLLTVFFFVWLNNLFGLIPFFPGSANLTGNIAVTAALAIITLIITLFSANKSFWKHIFMPPVPAALYPIMVPIEIIGIFTKPFALMMRLFANVTAGHIMILAIISLIFIFKNAALGLAAVPLALFVFLLELLVAALQAFIFTVLSALYIGMAVEDHDHDHAHNDHDSAGKDTIVA